MSETGSSGEEFRQGEGGMTGPTEEEEEEEEEELLDGAYRGINIFAR